MAELNALEQVKLEAERITRKRIQEAEEQKKWQESTTGTITFDDEQPVEVAVEEVQPKVVKTKTVKEKKGK